MKGENFCNQQEWEQLTKIGYWEFVLPGNYIRSAGVYRYLLSQYVYDSTPFTINANVQFGLNSKINHHQSQPINAGFVLGWTTRGNSFGYYHLLLTGTRLMLERVGASGRNHTADFTHLDDGIPLVINNKQAYEFKIDVLKNTIDVTVDTLFKYQFNKPADLAGLVGLRPWRSQMQCNRFEVRENEQASSFRMRNAFRNY